MQRCPRCDAGYIAPGPVCPECAGAAQPAPGSQALEVTDDYDADDLLPHAAIGGEAVSQRWHEFLADSPLGSTEPDPDGGHSAPVVEAAPPAAPAHTSLDVALTTFFDVHTAPSDSSPVVSLLVDAVPQGPALVAPSSGPVAHVILALDLSSSMDHADKYPVLQRAIGRMISDLRASPEGDVMLSIVAFAYGSETVFREKPASQLDAQRVLDRIDASRLKFTRYTDLAGALSRAGRIAFDSHKARPRVPIRIYALTDGRPQDLQKAREEMQRVARLPVDIHGLAFGADADVQVLNELIAGSRGGTVKSVRAETLSEAFGHIARRAGRVVAKRALLDLELAPGVVGGAAYRYRPGRHAYERTAFEGGRTFSRDLGTLEAGRHYSLLFELRLPPTMQDNSEVGRLTLRVPGDGGARTFECLLCIPRHKGVYTPTPNPVVAEARAVLDAMGSDDAQTALRALRARRRMYVEERRDPYLIALIDRAVAELEESGSLDALSPSERAALLSHTQSVVPEIAPERVGTTAQAHNETVTP